ncbi:MAG TPA: amidohydrolase/deacetylase family metallohydrolase [Streptosporangiaceae bacterium]
MSELIIAGGRLLDPGQGVDATGTITISGSVIAGRTTGNGGPSAAPLAAGQQVIDATGLIVTPGVVDVHTHLYEGVSHYGIDPDTHCLQRGVTTAVDAGSAGAQTFPGLRRYVIERSQTRVLAFLHIAVQGMITNLLGELEDLRWASVGQAVERAREHADLIIGIKVRLGYQMVGYDPAGALRLAREAADELGLPLMVHVIDMRPPISWLLPYLGPGDLVTHCYHGNEGGILDEAGRLYPDVLLARERGVLFDVGHGVGSFSYRVARAAIEQGFPPDTISSDLHAHNVGGPAYDQATTLAKLLHAGMPLAEVILATTATPARAVRRERSIGAALPGREADLTVFELRSGHWALPDAAGATETVEQLLVPRMVVRAGRARQLSGAPAGHPLAG